MTEAPLWSGRAHGGCSVLIAEDSPTQAQELRFRLEQHGFAVHLAGNGREALALAQQQRPTLLITDVVMPEMDGYTLCQAIKSDAGLQDMPVIIVTSLSGWDDITRSLECGADNFLRKPYEFEALLARIDYILLNRALRCGSKVRTGLELVLGGKRLFVNSEREQILDLLISTYEEVMHMNQALQSQQLEVARANQILRGLYQISKGITQADSVQAVCQGALQDMAALPGAQPAWVLLRGDEGAAQLVDGGQGGAGCRDEPACACRRALADGVEPRAQLAHCPCWPGEAGAGQLVLAPLRIGERLRGVLAMAAHAGSGRDTLDILGTVGQQISVALERVELLERLQQRAQQLESANQELESFSYSVSHDLRSPLRAVMGFSELLGDHLGPQLDDEGVRLLEVIRNSCHKMSALIDALLELSRVGRVQLREMAINMAAMAAEVAAELCPDPESQGLSLSIGALPATPGDPVLIRQVWANLIGNALKYSAGRSQRHIAIEGRRDGLSNVYAVRDNGVGFDMRYSDRLFGLFQRLHRAEDFPGTGIGLANVKLIIGRHGGKVWAESQPGQGANFYFSLPRVESS